MTMYTSYMFTNSYHTKYAMRIHICIYLHVCSMHKLQLLVFKIGHIVYISVNPLDLFHYSVIICDK